MPWKVGRRLANLRTKDGASMRPQRFAADNGEAYWVEEGKGYELQ